MNVLIILAHPDPASFNHAIADRVRSWAEAEGHSLALHDLYAERFDPVLPASEIPREGVCPPDVERQCADLVRADGIVVVHPNWWGQPPAILTGWIDRVVRPGVAYEFLEGDAGEGVPGGLLAGKMAAVFNTTNTSPEREMRVFGDPLERIWRDCVFGLCGIERFERRAFGIVVTSTAEQRRAWLDEVEATMERLFGRSPA